ncbi:sulfotransferase domain-containing protein [Sulfitobacter sp.]|uniref:sulfotransferase domain-containing protein n=1 Tax=Sulfitobacter sp. TaxID=1903071 RepID=UPI0030021D6C
MKSVIAASMHKAGSTVANSILLDFFGALRYEIDDISNKSWASPLTEAEFYIDYQKNILADGVYYGMARGPYVAKMDKINSLRMIVQIRDPRDCLTSLYFSQKESHSPPPDPERAKLFYERREKSGELSIDHFVLARAENYRRRMEILSKIINSHSDFLVLKYEEMTENTPKWLGKISDFLDQPISDELRSKLHKKTQFSVDVEDSSKHKRQVTPGDHKRKLKPETIVQLNNILTHELQSFGYAE